MGGGGHKFHRTSGGFKKVNGHFICTHAHYIFTYNNVNFHNIFCTFDQESTAPLMLFLSVIQQIA